MKIIKGFSTKLDGNMRIYRGNVHDKENENVRNKANRKLLLEKNNLDDANLVLAGLVHGNRIVVVGESDKGKVISECDGFVTDTLGMILGVTAADCLPIYFWNTQKTVVGIVHAGWRGVQKKIVTEMVSIFINKYGCLTKDIQVEIGPHIQGCHFEVKEDVINNFLDYPDCLSEVSGAKYLNLQSIIKNQLISSGIKDNNIKLPQECTFCEKEKYFSYRRDKPKDIEAMLAYITLSS
jgi:YfiH family protein